SRIFLRRSKGRAILGRKLNSLRCIDNKVVGRHQGTNRKRMLSVVGEAILHFKQRLLFTLVRLNGHVERVMPFLRKRSEMSSRPQPTRTRRRSLLEYGSFRQNNLESVLAELRARR